MLTSPFSPKNRISSFQNALKGIILVVKHETNARIHIAATISVVTGGFYFNVSSSEWIFLILSIGLVISMEAFNTCIEQLSNIIQPEMNDHIKTVKDIAAGSVLISAIAAAIVGFIIFTPKIISLW